MPSQNTPNSSPKTYPQRRLSQSSTVSLSSTFALPTNYNVRLDGSKTSPAVSSTYKKSSWRTNSASVQIWSDKWRSSLAASSANGQKPSTTLNDANTLSNSATLKRPSKPSKSSRNVTRADPHTGQRMAQRLTSRATNGLACHGSQLFRLAISVTPSPKFHPPTSSGATHK